MKHTLREIRTLDLNNYQACIDAGVDMRYVHQILSDVARHEETQTFLTKALIKAETTEHRTEALIALATNRESLDAKIGIVNTELKYQLAFVRNRKQAE